MLRESDSEDGIFHASFLPPTWTSLAAEKPKRRKRRKREAEEAVEKAAMECDCREIWLEKVESVEERVRYGCIGGEALGVLIAENRK